MDSDDDWENNLDDEVLEKKTGVEKKQDFSNENDVDSDDERKKEAEEEAKRRANQEVRVKNSNKKDYDKMFEERNAGKAKASTEETKAKIEKGGLMSREARGDLMAQAADNDAAEDLLGAMDLEGTRLDKEADYVKFGSKISSKLYSGKTTYNVVPFFKEISRPLGSNLDSKKIKQILDNLTKIYNEKVKEEREKEKPKASKKANIKGGKAYDKNNNQAMIDDIMGDDDEEGYGVGKEFKREQEADVDFM